MKSKLVCALAVGVALLIPAGGLTLLSGGVAGASGSTVSVTGFSCRNRHTDLRDAGTPRVGEHTTDLLDLRSVGRIRTGYRHTIWRDPYSSMVPHASGR